MKILMTRDNLGRFIKGHIVPINWKINMGGKTRFVKEQVAWNKGKSSPWTVERNKLNKGILSKKKDKEYVERIEKKCEYCGEVVRCRIRELLARSFCSRKCAFLFRGTLAWREEQSRIIKSRARRGKDNNRWKGGITPLYRMIRDLEENQVWRIKVFERDNYTCVKCGKRGYVEAHHIKPFSIICSEFLKKYNQFSIIEDKETLVRLAITYDKFWDIINGKTLCIKCHKRGRIKRNENSLHE